MAHDTLEEMRMVAVQRMNEGEHPAAVAASFGLHRSWAYKCRAASKGRGRGLQALRLTKGTGRPRKLTAAQERQVFGWVNGKSPYQHGLDHGLWTRQIVRDLVAQRFEVPLSLASIGAMLARLGLTVQKPLQRAWQRDPEAIERWKRETFPAIAAQARDSAGSIFFWDEAGFRADSVHGRTWGVRGRTPVVQRPGQRQSISAASAVNAKGAFWFATYPGALTGELFVALLSQLMHRRQNPVHLVADSLAAHKTAAVKEYVASTGGQAHAAFSARLRTGPQPR